MATAPLRWAENNDELWVTIELLDATDVTVVIEEDKFSFKGTRADKSYDFVIPLTQKVDAGASTYAVKDRGVEIRLIKQEDCQGWWGKLTKDASKKPFVKCDWELWADEDGDEEVKAPGADFGAGDLSALMGGMGGSMPGMGGPGGMDFASMMKGMGGMGGMPGMGGMGGPGGMPGMEGMDMNAMMSALQGMQGGAGEHVHGENCNHDHDHHEAEGVEEVE